jgi:hypothetical protein
MSAMAVNSGTRGDHGGRVLLTAFQPADHYAVVLAAIGTFETFRRSLRASGYRGRPEVDGRWSGRRF